jgi:hypothetical protein
MTAVLDLVSDLAHHGIQIYWGKKSLRLRGDLARLMPEHRQSLREQRKELETLARWQALQDESEARFGHPGAAFYPFCRLKLDRAPVVRTAEGPARVAQVLPNSVRVVLEDNREAWLTRGDKAEPLLMTELQFDQVWPPATPPEEVL